MEKEASEKRIVQPKEIFKQLRTEAHNSHYDRFPMNYDNDVKSSEEEQSLSRTFMRHKAINALEYALELNELPRLLDRIDPLHTDLVARTPLLPDTSEHMETIFRHITARVEEIHASETKEQEAVQVKLDMLTDTLLEQAVQHSETWKRTVLSLSEKDSDLFYNAFITFGLEHFITNHHYPDYDNVSHGYPGLKKRELLKVKPDGIYIQAESFDYRKLYPDVTDVKKSLEIGFIYASENLREADTVIVSTLIGKPLLHSHVVSTEFIETGYEGHSFHSFDPSVQEIDNFYSLIQTFSQGITNSDIPMEDYFSQIVLINEQTGQRKYYDKTARDWLPKEVEIFSENNEDALNKDNPYYPRIIVKNTYRMELLDEQKTS